MNELFEYHKQLNIKKIIIATILILFVIIIIIEILSGIFSKNSSDIIDNQNPNSIFYDNNQSISLELSKQYELSQYKTLEDYLIELRSPNDLNIFISRRNLVENRSLSEVASADLRAYIEEYTSYSNLSDVTEFSVKDNTAYTYSFHYLDSSNNVPFYLQVIWLQYSDGYYIFDIEFPLENLNNYTNIINETLNSFNIINK